MSKMRIDVRRIKDTFFSVNELIFRQKEPDVKFRLDHIVIPDIKTGLLNLGLRVQAHYDEYAPEQVVAEIQVQNLFEIEALAEYVNAEGKVFLPSDVLLSILSLSISHTRALLAKNLAGTTYSNLVLPILDPASVATAFFSDPPNKEKAFKHTANG